ncbi:MAG: nitroreductase family protein [Rikenellaceae bacterium]|jgi:nitroreductase|nr:nitroreductase family protein [Rikenellaceae bacterium]
MKTIFGHRSIRKYKSDPVSEATLEKILLAGTRASNTGNMQVYSIVVTTDAALREKLSPCHFGQPMVMQAPVVITFCADVRRFSQWCRLRGAEPEYDNFQWFVCGAIDAVLASQNVALEAEANGLGICFLGTTTYTADRIIDVLQLPTGVVPVTTLVLGYPDENPSLADRLPLAGIVHREIYRDYTDANIERIWEAREASDETKNLLEVNQLPNLAQIFTLRRYKGGDNIAFSRVYLNVLKRQGFMNQ